MKQLIKNILKEESEDTDQRVYNFLRRRYEVNDIDLGWEDNPINFRTINFDVYGEKYGFTTFENKKEQIRKIVDMLIIHNVIEPINNFSNENDPYRQKIVRTIKKFLHEVM